MRVATIAVLLAGALALPGGVASAAESEFAPVDRPGPALSVPADQLAASLVCTANVAKASRAPVLLLGGTGGNTKEYYTWNWQPALTKAGIPWCTPDVPDDGGAGNHNLADMQTRGEYVTYAIRMMYKLAGRKISIFGHSQGGAVMRWSLRFWPDTRRMVDDVISHAGTNHGSNSASLACAVPCYPAAWQQRSDSRFISAMNSEQETFAGISYTTVRSDQDQSVQPTTSTELSGPGWISNLRIQDRCPSRFADHLAVGTFDPVAEAYTMDALSHDGPAKLSRISSAVCFKPYMSGVNPLTVAGDLLSLVVTALPANLLAPMTTEEPPLRCYTLADGCT